MKKRTLRTIRYPVRLRNVVEICNHLAERNGKRQQVLVPRLLLYQLFIQLSQRHFRDSQRAASGISTCRSRERRGSPQKNERKSERAQLTSCRGLLKIYRIRDIVWQRPGRPDISLCRGNRTSLDARNASWKPSDEHEYWAAVLLSDSAADI